MAGAAFMVAGGVAFSILNVVTQWLTMKLGFPAASAAFWQYAFALVFSLPFLAQVGLVGHAHAIIPGATSFALPLRRLGVEGLGLRPRFRARSGRRSRWS